MTWLVVFARPAGTGARFVTEAGGNAMEISGKFAVHAQRSGNRLTGQPPETIAHPRTTAHPSPSCFEIRHPRQLEVRIHGFFL